MSTVALTFFLDGLRRPTPMAPMCRAALSAEVAAVKKEKKALKKRLRKLEAAMEDKEEELQLVQTEYWDEKKNSKRKDGVRATRLPLG